MMAFHARAGTGPDSAPRSTKPAATEMAMVNRRDSMGLSSHASNARRRRELFWLSPYQPQSIGPSELPTPALQPTLKQAVCSPSRIQPISVTGNARNPFARGKLLGATDHGTAADVRFADGPAYEVEIHRIARVWSKSGYRAPDRWRDRNCKKRSDRGRHSNDE